MQKDFARCGSGFAAVLCCAVVVFGFCSQASAGITTYGNGDREAWFEDVGAGGTDITTIGFNDLGHTIVTDQYAHLGITFDGNNGTSGEGCTIYPQDCWALRGQPNIAFEFDSPRNAIAADYPGSIRFSLFFEGKLIGIEDFFTGGIGNFAGLTSDIPFDSVIVERAISTGNPAFIDDLHFAAIPTPGGMIPLLFVCLARRHGRRRHEQLI